MCVLCVSEGVSLNAEIMHGTTFTIFEEYCKMNGQRNGYTCSADTRSVMGGSE